MKLFAKTSLYYLILSIPVLVIAGVVCFYLITAEVKESNNELLLNRKAQIEKYLNENDTISLQIITKSGEANITAVDQSAKVQNDFRDTLIFDVKENEAAPNQLLIATVKTAHGNFVIRAWRSTIEFDELFDGIATALFLILLLLLLIFFLINWWVTRTLWQPFYQTVAALKSFRASENEKPILLTPSVKEFTELNKSVTAMMDKMIADFKSQKQFTENASHEMQTPLAVIRTKIDLLIQSENIGETETNLILAIDDASSKLSRLNKALLLLTKIENRQFKKVENVSLNKVLNDSLELFNEHLEAKKITVTKIITSEVSTRINPDLCFVLINNILQNAIRHNIQNGFIEIKLEAERLTISNTGQPIAMDASKLFERFQKNSTSTDSLGLGLAIAKEIADASNIGLAYKYELNYHHFILFLENET